MSVEVLALGWSFRGELYKKHCLCISREICTVPSLSLVPRPFLRTREEFEIRGGERPGKG